MKKLFKSTEKFCVWLWTELVFFVQNVAKKHNALLAARCRGNFRNAHAVFWLGNEIQKLVGKTSEIIREAVPITRLDRLQEENCLQHRFTT